MQRDAQSVGKGVAYVAPPPAIGGQYMTHSYFTDLFDEQSLPTTDPASVSTILQRFDTRSIARRSFDEKISSTRGPGCA